MTPTRICLTHRRSSLMLNIGRRNDLLICREAFLAGKSFEDLFTNEDTFATACRYPKGLEKAASVLRPRNRDNLPLSVDVFYGPSGTGKTQAARLIDPDAYAVLPPNVSGGSIWFDGYTGQNTLLIDEYQGWIPWSLLKVLLDPWYPISTLQTKGGSVPAHYTRVILCSNVHPLRWHCRQTIRHLRALTRRLSRVWDCDFDVWVRQDLDKVLDSFESTSGPDHPVPESAFS